MNYLLKLVLFHCLLKVLKKCLISKKKRKCFSNPFIQQLGCPPQSCFRSEHSNKSYLVSSTVSVFMQTEVQPRSTKLIVTAKYSYSSKVYSDFQSSSNRLEPSTTLLLRNRLCLIKIHLQCNTDFNMHNVCMVIKQPLNQ